MVDPNLAFFVRLLSPWLPLTESLPIYQTDLFITETIY